MEISLGYHLKDRAQAFLLNDALCELFEILKSASYPPEVSRKKNQPTHPKGIKKPKARIQRSARRILRETLHFRLCENWQTDVSLFGDKSLPGCKLHYVKDRVGLIFSMQHRTTIGTDFLRFAKAYHPSRKLIDVGVFVCGTDEFETYYFATEKRRSENMITFEEVLDYLQALGDDIISVPIIIIGIKSPEFIQSYLDTDRH